MVKVEEVQELEKELRRFRGIVRRLATLNKMNWKVPIEVLWTDETITHTIPEPKKQAIIQEAKDKRNALKAKIDSIDWNSLN